jgi:hypothetical protein
MSRTFISPATVPTAFLLDVWGFLTAHVGDGDCGRHWTIDTVVQPVTPDRNTVLGTVACTNEDVVNTQITAALLADGVAQWAGLTLDYPGDQSETDLASAQAVRDGRFSDVTVTDLMGFISLLQAAQSVTV